METVKPNRTAISAEKELGFYVRRHLLCGWWSLLIFLSLGLVLEGLHALKVGFYLNVSNETRRLLWTLAHAHGTLLALVHVLFGATLNLLPLWNPRLRGLASSCLMAAGVLIPAGFFLGGSVIYAGDPGLGILLVPLGGILLFVAVLLTARGASSSRPVKPSDSDPSKASLLDKRKVGK